MQATKKISWKAKGLLAYLQKHAGEELSVARILKESVESRSAITSGLKELEDAGLLRRERQTTGRVIYRV